MTNAPSIAKRLLSCFGVFACCAATFAQQQDTPVRWPASEMNTVQAARSVAQSTSAVIVLEVWHDQTVMRQIEFQPKDVDPGEVVSGYADEIVANPARIIIPKPQSDLNAARAIDHIVASHGHLKKVSRFAPNIIDLARTELLDNPEWPLNKKLRAEDMETRLTVESASELLSNSYGMLAVKDPYQLFGIQHQIGKEPTVDGDSLQGGTVRDLVFKLIKMGSAQGLFHVLPIPTEPAGADCSNASSFKWSIRQLRPLEAKYL